MTENHNIIPARHIHEECGVFGIFTPQEADVASYAYYALYSLCLLYTSDAADE